MTILCLDLNDQGRLDAESRASRETESNGAKPDALALRIGHGSEKARGVGTFPYKPLTMPNTSNGSRVELIQTPTVCWHMTVDGRDNLFPGSAQKSWKVVEPAFGRLY